MEEYVASMEIQEDTTKKKPKKSNVKKPQSVAHKTDIGENNSGHESSARPHAELMAKTINLIEIRAGLFLNVDHIVSVRVLPQEEGNDYAILQLSNGDKLSLTLSEFSKITGEEPRLIARLPQKIPVESKA